MNLSVKIGSFEKALFRNSVAGFHLIVEILRNVWLYTT